MFRWLPLLEEVLQANEDITLAVHSSWKQYLTNQQMHEILGPLASRYIGITSLGTGRYHGIIELVERAQVENYIIIDDATDEFPRNLPELIATDPVVGISDKAVIERISDWVSDMGQKHAVVHPEAALSPGPGNYY